MFNELPNELRNIQREIDRIVDAMIDLLPREEQTEIIRKEAERREKARIETTLLEAKREALEKEWEALEAETERQRQGKLREWQNQMVELHQALASVPEGRLSIKLCLKGGSSSLLKARLKHGIKLSESRSYRSGDGSPSAVL
jgi:vacuolar-type H+-ATPase subunit E/Vma4